MNNIIPSFFHNYNCNNNSSNNNIVDMAMEDHIHLHGQHHHRIINHPLTSLYPSFSFQTPETRENIPQINLSPPSTLFSHHHQTLQTELKEDQDQEDEEEEEEELGAMKEMMYRIAAMQPVDIDPATVRKPKRRNVRISDDPQSVAARHRRERISEKIRILQRLVPGGTKMDTASMLDEAIRYVKFLKRQIRILQTNSQPPPPPPRPSQPSITPPYNKNNASFGRVFGSEGDGPALCFNHEVISDN